MNEADQARGRSVCVPSSQIAFAARPTFQNVREASSAWACEGSPEQKDGHDDVGKHTRSTSAAESGGFRNRFLTYGRGTRGEAYDVFPPVAQRRKIKMRAVISRPRPLFISVISGWCFSARVVKPKRNFEVKRSAAARLNETHHPRCRLAATQIARAATPERAADNSRRSELFARARRTRAAIGPGRKFKIRCRECGTSNYRPLFLRDGEG